MKSNRLQEDATRKRPEEYQKNIVIVCISYGYLFCEIQREDTIDRYVYCLHHAALFTRLTRVVSLSSMEAHSTS